MKTRLLFIPIIFLLALSSFAQGSAGSVYGGSRRRSTGVITGQLMHTDPKDSLPSSFIEANVLLNAKADEYLAVFGLAQDALTLLESNKKIEAQIKEFLDSLGGLGVKPKDIFVDFITQNRVYDFTVSSSRVAEEKAAGFEVKKNVAVRYKDRALLEKMLAAAAQSSIFDLIKDDYIVSDMAAARHRLLEEASKIVKDKETTYARLFGIKMRPASVYEEKYNAFFPSEMYDSYVAYESSGVDSGNLGYVRHRKTSTSYLSTLHPAEFDAILNPAGAEPVVQLTLFLKVKYSPAQ